MSPRPVFHPLDALHVPTRYVVLLEAAGIVTGRDFLLADQQDLLRIDGVDHSTIAAVKGALEESGIVTVQAAETVRDVQR